jgi:hypothetical protein
MVQFRRILSAIGALAALAVTTAQAQLSDDQRKCVYTINKDAIKVQATQSKVGVLCVKEAPATAEACMASDPTLKVQAKITRALEDDARRCMDPPAFAYLGAGTAAAVAVQTSKDLFRDVFGNPVEDGLYACDTHRSECACQQHVINRVAKTLDAASRIFVRCKGGALKLGATSAAQIADCVTDPANELSIAADPKGKLARRRGLLIATLSKYCQPPPPNDPFGSGLCPGASGPAGADCLKTRVLCRACEMAKGADGLAIDCSAWLGTSCP